MYNFDMRKGLILYNPIAGKFSSPNAVKRAASVLRQNNWEIEILPTESAEHLTQTARESAETGADALFVAGGDGSMQDAAKGLSGSETALGVLPAGTVNVLAHELGFPSLSWLRPNALSYAARKLADGILRPIDVGYCNEVPFLLWIGIGFDAYIVHMMEKQRKRWHRQFPYIRYTLAIFGYGPRWKGFRARLTTNGNTTTDRYVMFVGANIRTYGGRAVQLSPDAKIGDGMMEGWAFHSEPITLPRIVGLIWSAFRQQHLTSNNIRLYPFTQIDMQSDSPMYIHLDGDPFPLTKQISIRVQHNGIKLLVPKDLHL